MIKSHINPRVFLMIFSGIVILDLILENIVHVDKRAFTTPLINASLLVFFGFNGRKFSMRVYSSVMGSLFFSMIANILLVYDASSPTIFKYVTYAFMVSNILLTIALSCKFEKPKSLGFLIMPIIFIAYTCYFYLKLEPNLGQFKILIIFYIIGLLILIIIALCRENDLGNQSFTTIIMGVAMFLVSNTCFGVNKFYLELPIVLFLNTVTYAIGMYLIIYGLLIQDEKQH